MLVQSVSDLYATTSSRSVVHLVSTVGHIQLTRAWMSSGTGMIYDILLRPHVETGFRREYVSDSSSSRTADPDRDREVIHG